MTREILFRGKSNKDGSWAEGMLTKDQKGHFRIQFDPSLFSVIVIPETVGQFTGFKDKNGKNIFEGDIVKATMTLMHSNPIVKICHVYYDKCCFGINWNGKYISNFCNFHCVEFEIIGNIFDNKEILAKL